MAVVSMKATRQFFELLQGESSDPYEATLFGAQLCQGLEIPDLLLKGTDPAHFPNALKAGC